MFLFGLLPSGAPIHQASLRQAPGLEVRVLTYGGIITALRVPDGRGHAANVVLGFDTLAGYLGDSNYLGALIGRYANRIARGRFPLAGATYQLDLNDGRHHLHGGH